MVTKPTKVTKRKGYLNIQKKGKEVTTRRKRTLEMMDRRTRKNGSFLRVYILSAVDVITSKIVMLLQKRRKRNC